MSIFLFAAGSFGMGCLPFWSSYLTPSLTKTANLADRKTKEKSHKPGNTKIHLIKKLDLITFVCLQLLCL